MEELATTTDEEKDGCRRAGSEAEDYSPGSRLQAARGMT